MQLDWEIWLDNHLSPIIAKWLKDKTGWQVKSSYSLQLYILDDFEIYAKAKAVGKVILISKDSDLDSIISTSGPPPKLIKLNIGNCDNRILFEILENNIERAIRLLLDFNRDIVEINE